MDLLELLDEARIPYLESGHEHCRDGWVQIDCPDCTPGANHWRLGINKQGLYGNCWQCGPMHLAMILSKCSSLNKKTIVDFIRQLDRSSSKQLHHSGRYKEPKNLRELQKLHRMYLTQRGFKPFQLSTLWGIKSYGLRIFIPVELNGDKVAWTSRSIVNGPHPRYMSSQLEHSTIPIKYLLYGEDFAINSILIVEGPTDVWKIGPGAVATFGTAITTQQIERIAKYPNRIICFDAERSAQKKAEELLHNLAPLWGETTNVVLNSGKDPASCNKKELKQLRAMLK